jgi:glycosyltransferase involved in cell wall biosynthesis
MKAETRSEPSVRTDAVPSSVGRPLCLFYEQGHPDRWLPFDRYPRAVVRRLLRGPTQPGGHTRVFLNLCAGLDRLGVPYRVNAYRYLRRHPDEVACVIGKPLVLDKIPPSTPIVFGAAGYDHPVDKPTLLSEHAIRGILVPCEWVRRMFEPHWGDKVHVWPVGIDTDGWRPSPDVAKDFDVLVYDKIRCHLARDHAAVRDPILRDLEARGLRVAILRYGFYREEQYRNLLARSRSMVFLCEHETQGIALQQALSCEVPVFAWDLGGVWQDTNYYPDRVQFSPVTSVPYWDERCGMKFHDAADFNATFQDFWAGVTEGKISPRAYVTENLTLEAGARHYVDLVHRLAGGAAETPPCTVPSSTVAIGSTAQ